MHIDKDSLESEELSFILPTLKDLLLTRVELKLLMTFREIEGGGYKLGWDQYSVNIDTSHFLLYTGINPGNIYMNIMGCYYNNILHGLTISRYQRSVDFILKYKNSIPPPKNDVKDGGYVTEREFDEIKKGINDHIRDLDEKDLIIVRNEHR